jgi:hypothetical protein
MAFLPWLQVVAIGLPLIAALFFWIRGNRLPGVRNRLALGLNVLLFLLAASLFLFSSRYACILAGGPGNCLYDGAGTLALIVLDAWSIERCIALRNDDQGYNYAPRLLLSGALAGLAFAENLLEFLIFLNLFVWVAQWWARKRGYRWGFFTAPPERQDHPK